MKFLMMIYADDSLLEALSAGEFDTRARGCLEHADELRFRGKLRDSQQLEPASTARSVRIRGERTQVIDGSFAQTKECLPGFNLIEAADMDEAVRMALEFPWARTGCIEPRPVRDMDAVRQRVGVATWRIVVGGQRVRGRRGPGADWRPCAASMSSIQPARDCGKASA